MAARSTILIGLLLCAVVLAGTQLTPAPIRGGVCEEIEAITSGVGYRPNHRVFEKRDELYEWFVIDGRLVIDHGNGRREEWLQSAVESFTCALPQPAQ